MQAEKNKSISAVRLQHAEECLVDAQDNISSNRYKNAANRSYYAIFHAMRAAIALEGIDSKKHSGVISEFRRLYIKTGVFDKKLSKDITDAFDIRTDCDYDDFFVVSKEEVEEQVKNAEKFVNAVKNYLATKE